MFKKALLNGPLGLLYAAARMQDDPRLQAAFAGAQRAMLDAMWEGYTPRVRGVNSAPSTIILRKELHDALQRHLDEVGKRGVLTYALQVQNKKNLKRFSSLWADWYFEFAAAAQCQRLGVGREYAPSIAKALRTKTKLTMLRYPVVHKFVEVSPPQYN